MYPSRESKRISISKKYVETAPLEIQTKHDQAAALLGLLSGSGLTVEMLMNMNAEKRRETLMNATTIRNSTRLTAQERLSLKGPLSFKQEHLSLKKPPPVACRYMDESGSPVIEKGESFFFLCYYKFLITFLE
jgi:hypothetical protein